jgi:YfiH family protein
VARNRALLMAECASGHEPVRWMLQVHGTAVAEANAAPTPATPGAGSAPEPAAAGAPGSAVADVPGTDALLTRVAGLPLGVLVADCAPVLIADGQAGVAGVAHAGRAGLARGVVPALIAAMTQAGADPARLRAVVGPMICGSCYEVPAALREEVAAAVPGTASVTRWSTPGIDIRAGLQSQLKAAGVSQVSHDTRCTAERRELYSYRRDTTTGRFAGLIWLAPPA